MFTWYIKFIPLYICVGDSERGKKIKILVHYFPQIYLIIKNKNYQNLTNDKEVLYLNNIIHYFLHCL